MFARTVVDMHTYRFADSARSLIYGLIWLAVLYFSCSYTYVCHAASLGIDPIRIELSEAQPSNVIKVENTSDAVMTLQLQPMSWSQEEKIDQLTPTRDILATPQVFRIKPGAVQWVRVGLLRKPDSKKELAFRLLLDEVPPPPAPDFKGLQVALRVSVPVFIKALQPSAADLSFFVSPVDEDKLRLILNNKGNEHAHWDGLQLRDENHAEQIITSLDKSIYVLPGEQKEVLLTKDKNTSKNPEKIFIKAKTIAGTLEFHGISVAP